MTLRSPRRPRVALIGAGALGRSLAPALAGAGYRLTAIASSDGRSARALARRVGGARAVPTAEAVQGANLVLLAVSDRAVAKVARGLAVDVTLDWSERIVLHHAGSLDLGPLAPLAALGAGVGLLHPLQTLSGSPLATRLIPGSHAQIDGDRRGRAAARQLARALGLIPLSGRRHGRSPGLIHAGASMVANDLLALLHVGIELLVEAGVPRPRARQALVALARGTLAQAADRGPLGALTGAVARGDLETLRTHLQTLGARWPAAASAHRGLSVLLNTEIRRQQSRRRRAPGSRGGPG